MTWNFILTATILVSANLFDAIKHNRLAESKKNLKVKEGFILDLMDDNNKDVLHYNLGVLYLKHNEIDKAKRQFTYVLKQNNCKACHNAAFNMGVILSNEQKIDEAISSYQKALDINPEFIEAKHNIELLLKQQNKQEQNKESQTKQNPNQEQQNQDESKAQNEPNELLSADDEQEILDEILRQEQRIRKRQHKPSRKVQKDW